MLELIDSLPGIDLPVGAVSTELSKMWDGHNEEALSEFRASQMNLVLHFGKKVDRDEARKRFEIAVRFAQRYPSRIIVLCPFLAEEEPMRAKLFSQCFIGESHREMCCCEALLLGFTSEDNGFLFNQVSVWLESDLPTYHWFSGVRSERIENYRDNLLQRVNRMAYDSNTEPSNWAEIDWPNPKRVTDLAKARLLPVRQAIGQYLSGYPIGLLQKDLCAVEVKFTSGRKGEAQHLMEWLRNCLGLNQEFPVDQSLTQSNSGKTSLGFELSYKDNRHVLWLSQSYSNTTQFKHTLNGNEKSFPIRIKPLLPEQELAEAFFF